MLSNNQIKIYSSLRNKKYRQQHKLFLAEGEKLVLDILNAPSRVFKVRSLLADKDFLDGISKKLLSGIPGTSEVNTSVLGKISSLSTPNKAVLVCDLPEFEPDFSVISGGLCLYLEDIRDPGNLGTIMRTADWFGIHHIFCSNESVDAYNPKTVQSTMGALCRVKVYYTDISGLLEGARKIGSFPLIGTLMEGPDIFASDLPKSGCIVMGNESRGISSKLLSELDFKFTIPSTGNRSLGSESLNVASAAAIVMAEFRRRDRLFKMK